MSIQSENQKQEESTREGRSVCRAVQFEFVTNESGRRAICRCARTGRARSPPWARRTRRSVTRRNYKLRQSLKLSRILRTETTVVSQNISAPCKTQTSTLLVRNKALHYWLTVNGRWAGLPLPGSMCDRDLH